MKRVLAWIIILALIGGGIAAYFWWRGEQATAQQSSNILRTEQVTSGDLNITVVASGNVAVNNRLDLRFSSSGIVDQVYVKVNQRVQAGDVLAQLETTDLERAVQQAEIALEQAKLSRSILSKPPTDNDVQLAKLNVQSAAQALESARLGKQTAQVDADAMTVQAQRAREQAYNEYSNQQNEDTRSKFENAEEQEYIARINAEVTLEQAQSQWLSAYTRYEQAVESLRKLEEGPDEQKIRQADLQIEQAQLNLDQAQARLDEARLTAPFAGLIAAVNAQEGVQASLTTAAFTLVDDSQYYVDVTVDEIDIGKIDIGQTVDVTLDAYPESVISGTVESIAPGALNVGGIISYRLRVLLSAPPTSPPSGGTEGGNSPTIRDGMTASVVIHTDVIKDVLLVPNWAVRADQSTGETIYYCYILGSDGTLERRDITRGQYNETSMEVLSGLQAGDTVALVTEERSLLDLMPVEGP